MGRRQLGFPRDCGRGRDTRGRATPPRGAVRTGGRPRPRAPGRRWLLSPGFTARDPLPHSPGHRPARPSRLPASPKGGLWRNLGADRRRGPRATGPGQAASRVRHWGRGASGSSPRSWSQASRPSRPRSPLARLASNRRTRPAAAARPALGPAPRLPPPRAAGAGPRGCPGDTQCLCSEWCAGAAMASLFRLPAPARPEQRLQVKVVGLFKSSSFQIAKSTAEVTAERPPCGRRFPLPRPAPLGGRRSASREGAVPPRGPGKVGVRGGRSA